VTETVVEAVASGEAGSAVSAVSGFRRWLASVDVASLSDRERVDLVAELERSKGAASAAQARLVHSVRRSREVAAPQDVARSVGSEVALARRESPSCGDRFLRVSTALLEQMPETLRALGAGVCSEAHAVRLVEATSCLSPADRSLVDARVGPLLGRLGVSAADRADRRVAAELDAAAVVARMEAAVRSRRVTMRAAADGMAYLTVLGPMTEVAGAHAALNARARTVTAGHAPEEPHLGRGVGAVAADTALRLLSGRERGEVQPVELHLVMTDRALLGTGDPGRSEWEPVRIPGLGSLPAPVARWWLRDQLDDTDPDARAAQVWMRRLYTSPDGRDLVSMDSRRRVFSGMLRRMLVLRDDLCTTPYCGAAIAHADHATPARKGGATSYVEGNGKCARCNHTKEAPGWRTEVVVGRAPKGLDERESRDATRAGVATRTQLMTRPQVATRTGSTTAAAAPTRPRLTTLPPVRTWPSVATRQLVIRTPLGRVYTSEPPPLLGWGSPDVPHETGPADRRKRPLRRRRPSPARATVGRRQRATSHLERHLCRYLT